MRRLVIFILASMHAVSCTSSIDDETQTTIQTDLTMKSQIADSIANYIFHDDIYPVRYKSELTKIPDSYYLLVSVENLDQVIDYLQQNDISITSGPTEYHAYPYLSNYRGINITLTNNLTTIPYTVYSNYRYKELPLETNLMSADFKSPEEEQRLITYAEILNIRLVNKYQIEDQLLGNSEGYMCFCINESLGNCVEIANCLTELGKFKVQIAYHGTHDVVN